MGSLLIPVCIRDPQTDEACTHFRIRFCRHVRLHGGSILPVVCSPGLAEELCRSDRSRENLRATRRSGKSLRIAGGARESVRLAGSTAAGVCFACRTEENLCTSRRTPADMRHAGGAGKSVYDAYRTGTIVHGVERWRLSAEMPLNPASKLPVYHVGFFFRLVIIILQMGFRVE